MAKLLKQRISKLFPSLQSCRSKDPASLPENPVPAAFCLSPVNPKPSDIEFPAAAHHLRSRKKKELPASPAVVAIGCRCRSKPANGGNVVVRGRSSEEHVESPRLKIDYTDPDDVGDRREKTKKAAKKKREKKASRFSISSANSGWLGSEDPDADRQPSDGDGETETLFSSRSFSTDSSYDFKSQLPRKPVRLMKRGRRRSGGRSVQGTASWSSPETDAPARVSVFCRLIPCTLDRKVRESFAVVKRSEDPYEDFRLSMAEMILEKQMFDAGDLEQLLHCFLSLNSEAHHSAIVQAFSEIWEYLFCNSPN